MPHSSHGRCPFIPPTLPCRDTCACVPQPANPNVTATADEDALDRITDWDIEFQVMERHTDNHSITIPDLPWESALCYDGPNIREQLESPGIYHVRVVDKFLVGISFRFHLDAAGEPAATPSVHPAHESNRGDYYTNESTNIMSADIAMIPRSPATRDAIIAHIQAND